MSDGDEAGDGFALAYEEACALNKLDPNHELLRFFTEGGENDAVWEEFQERFGKPGITKEERKSAPGQTYFFVQYFIALRETTEALEKSAKEK